MATPFPFFNPSIPNKRKSKTMTGYSDSKKPPMPPIESVAGYRKDKAPDAARFSKGASNINEIKQAADARRAHSAEITNRSGGPRSSGHHDSKGV
jgi:hypothetical protein